MNTGSFPNYAKKIGYLINIFLFLLINTIFHQIVEIPSDEKY
jgi:hypothetical protein